MSKKIDIVLVGIGGYGAGYVRETLVLQAAGQIRISAVIDPFARENRLSWPPLQATGVPCFDTLEAGLAAGIRGDLAVISSPIGFHAEQVCAAVAAGMDVLCEKPLCGHASEIPAMLAARDQAGRTVSVGYQWSFSKAISQAKEDILAGRFGAPLDFRSLTSWPRGRKYYERNNWAGRIRDDQGRWVCDSPANNATAHFLHSMLYLLGPQRDRSATPTAVTGECYRANPIENFDAVCCRIDTREGVPVLFFSAHCVAERQGPIVQYRFEEAVMELNAEGTLCARCHNGEVIEYGQPGKDNWRKLRKCIEWTREDRRETWCGIEAAMRQTQCVSSLQQVPINTFPSEIVRHQPWEEDDELTRVSGLEQAMTAGFDAGQLFSEMDVPWSVAARRVDLAETALDPLKRSS